MYNIKVPDQLLCTLLIFNKKKKEKKKEEIKLRVRLANIRKRMASFLIQHT